ncbi:DEAD/DEAH box helicase [Brevundimonas sp.]|uniref:DEAD/DEAH box helicase n=1 Tax=Brevundimonas sp. TaxID=1871086 RepID=UPI002D28E098|nr:DEAD/DEAH box helicase [Brevundimonas sp.]HYD28907.1 DEAD/DEAH box helicase [Brevundimonas sp.]
MAEALTLRPYQQRAIDKTYAAYGAGRRRVPLVLPTGGGKTVVFARAAVDCVAAGAPVLVLAHRTELIDSAEEKLLSSSAGLSVGVLQGRRREVDRAVIVGSVQTVVRPGALGLVAARRPGLVIVDETHHIAAPSYQTILRGLGVFEPTGPLLLGVTATLGRADGLALGDTFDGPPSEVVPMDELIRDGWLLRPRGVRVKVEGLDFSRVRTSRTSDSGLDDRAVAQAMSDALAPAAIARAVLEHGKGRRGVAFLPSVELSKEQARVFAEHGLRSIHVDADTPKAVRKEIIKRARLGEYDVVCNVGLFTEGTDVPIWDLVVLGRPTSSEVLFQQMAGRGLRPYPGQTDCLVLDVVGATGRHRLRSVVQLEGAEMIEDLDDELKQFDDESDVDDDEPKTVGAPTPDELHGVDGELGYELIDLFSASHTAWQRSPRGVWYLPTGSGAAVILVPAAEVDRYDVRWTDGELVHEDPCDITAAMSWGEKAARARAERPLERAAAWRGKRLTRSERIAAIYAGEAPGGEQAPTTVGALVEAQDARWAATAIDTLPCVEQVSPAGYWTT